MVAKQTHANEGEKMPTLHTVTFPDGGKSTRKSKNRVYTHALIAFDSSRDSWVIVGYASRLDLAEKNLDRHLKMLLDHPNSILAKYFDDFRIVEVEREEV